MTARKVATEISPLVMRPWPRYGSAETCGALFDRSGSWAREKFGKTPAYCRSLKRFDLVKALEIVEQEASPTEGEASLADLI